MGKIKITLLAVLLISILAFQYLTAEETGGCKELVFKQLEHLPHKVESYPFRVWYATEGENAIKDQAVAVSKNQQPVFIDDLLVQLHAADAYYSKQLGLQPPLSKQRYKKAKFVDVYIVNMSRGNGVAFDEVIASKPHRGEPSYSCGVKFHVNKNIDPKRNVTPAHELFHMYQSANSMFKARWYLEGMARWVEQAFRGVSPRDLAADAPNSCVDVYNESYSASRYWQDLAKRKNADDIVLSQDYLQLKYSNETPVFKQATFKHGAIISDLFQVLESESIERSKEIGYSKYRWPEKVQRSADFNEYICDAVESIE